jgi:hypothetical protein
MIENSQIETSDQVKIKIKAIMVTFLSYLPDDIRQILSQSPQKI